MSHLRTAKIYHMALSKPLAADPQEVRALLAPVRIAVASGSAFIVSQLLDVAVFNRLRKLSWWKAPLFGSVAASVVDTAIFFSLAFAGAGFHWLQLAAGDLGVKLAMAVALLPPYRALVARLTRP